MSAFDRYRALAREYRSDSASGVRRRHVAEQIPLCKRRCEQMQRAKGIGVIAAMLLIFTLLAGTVETILGNESVLLKWAGSASAVLGLSPLLRPAFYLILEDRNVVTVLHSEVKDLADLADKAGVRRDR